MISVWATDPPPRSYTAEEIAAAKAFVVEFVRKGLAKIDDGARAERDAIRNEAAPL